MTQVSDIMLLLVAASLFGLMIAMALVGDITNTLLAIIAILLVGRMIDD